MYVWLWRALPGGRVAKSVACLVLFLLVGAALFYFVFPHVDAMMPFDNVTVD